VKGERILYVILILIALVIGFYGALSGLFTPHHYYDVNSRDGNCTSPDMTFYINKRENYLTYFNYPGGEPSVKHQKIDESDDFINWGHGNNEIVGVINLSKIDNIFTGSINGETVFSVQTCSITKQFLQRN
tara:strand:- start:51 stop:443 length:393 start_codon:yes stop_codon:yes gene_type:complete